MEIILPQLGLFLWTVILFGIFAVIMAKYAWKPIMQGLKERETSIADALQSAEKAREEMANLQSENEALLKEARIEKNKIIQEAKVISEQMVAKAKADAAAVASKEMEKAKIQIESEKMAALTELKNQAGLLSLQIAEKVLKNELADRPAQEAFANKLISELSNN